MLPRHWIVAAKLEFSYYAHYKKPLKFRAVFRSCENVLLRAVAVPRTCKKKLGDVAGRAFFRLLRFSSGIINPPISHTHSFIYHQQHISLASDSVVVQHTCNLYYCIVTMYGLQMSSVTKPTIFHTEIRRKTQIWFGQTYFGYIVFLSLTAWTHITLLVGYVCELWVYVRLHLNSTTNIKIIGNDWSLFLTFGLSSMIQSSLRYWSCDMRTTSASLKVVFSFLYSDMM
jgi:hypothetical protein